jgi:RHS repeat-associated protein
VGHGALCQRHHAYDIPLHQRNHEDAAGGQRLESYINLYWYGSRWYDAYLNRWIQPDSIIPDPNDSQSYDRYAYVLNNPLRYIDPSGNRYCTTEEALAGDETCEQNYPENEPDYIIHMVLIGARYIPINSIDISEPEKTAPSIINTILSVIKNGGDALTHNQSYKADIFTWLSWNEYDDGSVGLVSITTNNYSTDATFYLTSVDISTKKDIFRNTPNGGVINTPQVNDYQISPINSDYLFTSHPNSSQTMNLCIVPYSCGGPNFERVLTVSLTAFISISTGKIGDPMYGNISYTYTIPPRF